MYPAAAVVPKALLPVGTWPMLHWALDEVLRAGIRRIALVTGPDQPLVHEYLEAAAAASEGDDDLARLGAALAQAEVVAVVQERPAGVGDAFYRCREITGDAPFAVLLPDNWFDGARPAIEHVAAAYAVTGACSFGLVEISAQEAHLYGNVGGCELEPVAEGVYRVTALQDKLPGHFQVGADSVLRGCARYVVDGRFYDALRATGPPPAGEWDDVPAFQYLLARGELAAGVIRGKHYDVGHPEGYLAAAAYLAGRRAAQS